MIILGLDQAPTGIAFAHGEPGAVPVRGYKEVPDFGNNTARLGEWVFEWTTARVKSIGADRIYGELPVLRMKGFNAPIFYKQVVMVVAIELACAKLGLRDHVYFPEVNDWRKEAYAGERAPRITKKQREAGLSGIESDAWKDMAVTECARRSWYISEVLDRKPNHNVAEACLIWDYGCKHADRVYRMRQKVHTRRRQSEADEARRAGL